MHLPHMVVVTTESLAESGPGATKISRRWLVKFAPFRTSWREIVQRGTFTLRGVRSPTARNNLAAMKLGDLVFYYHSQKELAVVGLMQVSKEAYPDPTSADPRWLTCDFVPIISINRSVSRAQIKAEAVLKKSALIQQPRLAVMPLSEKQFRIILKMGDANI
jgi:predicted RNA-binding protein with PUA-like domain